MTKNEARLIELISEREFVLWIGAGLSRYSGLPLGWQLGAKLNECLAEDAHKEGAGLLQIATTYEKKFGREKLLHFVEGLLFKEAPTSIKYHKILSTIPFFRTILTTNYDYLFELAYQNQLIKICSPKDWPKIDGKRTELLKLHGDFTCPENIVLTTDDYARFIREMNHSVVGDFIKQKAACNHILFIGYAGEDVNILSLLDEVSLQIGEDRKEWFLIAPGLKDFQVVDFKKRGITCIDSTGEAFIESLEKELNENIIVKFRKQQLNPSLFCTYLTQRGLIPQIEIHPSGEQKLVNLKNADGGKMKLRLSTHRDIISKIQRFSLGEESLELTLNGDKLKDFSLQFNGVTVLQSSEIHSLKLSALPSTREIADIRFSNEELPDAAVETFNSQAAFNIQLTYQNLKLRLSFKKPMEEGKDGHVELELYHHYKSVKDGLLLAKFLHWISSGKPFWFERANEKHSISLMVNKENLEMAKIIQRHFNDLKTIEKFYAIKFKNFDINDEDEDRAKRLIRFIKGEVANYGPITGKIERESFNVNGLKKIQEESSDMRLWISDSPPTSVYGQQLGLFYICVEIFKTEVSNLDDLLNNKTDIMSLKSRIGKVKIKIHKEDPVTSSYD